MSAENKAVARRYFEEVWNLLKPTVLNQIIANGAIDHDPANPSLPLGPDGQKQLFTKYTAAFPDSQFKVDAIIAEGDLVAVRWSVRGTHQGTLEGLAATGKQVNLTGTTTHAHRQRENRGDAEQLGCARHGAATRGCGSCARRLAGSPRCSFVLMGATLSP